MGIELLAAACLIFVNTTASAGYLPQETPIFPVYHAAA